MIRLAYCDCTGIQLDGLEAEMVKECSSSDVLSAARFWVNYAWKETPTANERARMIDYLRFTGGWCGEDLNEETDETLKERILWIACCDQKETWAETEIPSKFWSFIDESGEFDNTTPIVSVRTCYAIYTLTSVENGEAEERGIECESEKMSVADLVAFVANKSPLEWSDSTPSDRSWLYELATEKDYRTGEETERTYHFNYLNDEAFAFLVWLIEREGKA